MDNHQGLEAGANTDAMTNNTPVPSLLPREASVAFSADLLPHLKSLGSSAPPWQRCLRTFHAACDCVGVGVGVGVGK